MFYYKKMRLFGLAKEYIEDIWKQQGEFRK